MKDKSAETKTYVGVTPNRNGRGFRGYSFMPAKKKALKKGKKKAKKKARIQANAKGSSALITAQYLNSRCRSKGIPIPNPDVGFADPAKAPKGRPRKKHVTAVKSEAKVKLEIVDCLNPFCSMKLHPVWNPRKCGLCDTFRLGMK